MKLLYTSDLHGNEAHYGRLIAAAREVRPDVVILGGDLLPDDSALDRASMGVGQPKYVSQQFRKHVQTIREQSGCKHVLVIFGNHDWTSSVTAMSELAKDGLVTVLTLDAHASIDGVEFVGYSCSPPTPWFVKDFERLDRPGDLPPLLGGAKWDPRFSRASPNSATVLFKNNPTIQDELAKLKAPAGPWVFVAHAPPFESNLDRTYGKIPWGSKSIRAAIEKHQPMLSIHGHVHESPTVTGSIQDTLGKTVSVNPGQARLTLSYATIEIDPKAGRVVGVQHGQQA
jgi:Icc-related predicted phosphoesterase